MSSFNKIEKVKYTAPSQIGIALIEYISFKNEEDNEQYILLKLKNLLAQKVKKFSFKIREYDESGFMLAESEYNYDLEADANEAFIPKAKLKVNPNCKRIEYTLIYALFESVEYKDGKIDRVIFSLDSFRKEAPVEEKAKASVPIDKKALRRQRKADRKIQKIENKARLKRTKKVLRGKVFTVKKVTKMTRPKAPIIFAVVNTLFIALGVMLISYIYQKNSKLFTVDYIDYTINSDQVSVTASDSNLSLDQTSVTIPSSITISGKTYTVTAIGEGAFKNTPITNLTFKGDIIIGKSAFENCKKLKTINGGENVTYVSSSAFKGCESLVRVSLDNATIIEDEAFSKCVNLESLYAPYAKAYKLSFDGCMALSSIYLYNTFPTSLYRLFTEEIDTTKVPQNLDIYITYTNYSEEFLHHLNSFRLYSYDPTNDSTSLLEERRGASTDSNGVISVSSDATVVYITSEVTKFNDSITYLKDNCHNLEALYIEAESFEDEINPSLLNGLNIKEFGMKYDLNLGHDFLNYFYQLTTLYLYNSILSSNYHVPGRVNTLKINYPANMHIYMSDFSGVFDYTSITNITVESGILEGDSLSMFANLETLSMPIGNHDLSTLGVSLNLRTLTLTGSGYDLNDSYIDSYWNLLTLTVNGNPGHIYQGAVRSCENLTQVYLNVTDTYIHAYSFLDCAVLEEYNIVIQGSHTGTKEGPLTDK